MNFTPLHDRVLVRRIESEDVTKGGLIIPDSANPGKAIPQASANSLQGPKRALPILPSSQRGNFIGQPFGFFRTEL